MTGTREAIEITSAGDHPLHYLASSRSRPGQGHSVDLGAHNGNGGCTCEHFEFRILPDLREKAALRPAGWAGCKSTRCSHILAARRAFCDSMIARIGQAMPTGDVGE